MRLQVLVTKLNFPSFSVGSMWMIKSTEKTSVTLLLCNLCCLLCCNSTKKLPNKACLCQDMKRAKVIWKCLTMSIYFQTKSLQWTKSLVNQHTHQNHLWVFTPIKITCESSYHNYDFKTQHFLEGFEFWWSRTNVNEL